MGCGEGLAKLLVFVANFAFVLVGIALLVVGILYKLDINKVTDAIPDDYQGLHMVPTFSIVIGSIIFFIAFLGCCGACKKNTCMLTSYGTILLLIFILQVALGIYAFVKIKDQNDLEKQIDKQVDKLFGNYGKNKEAVDAIQKNLKCCGQNGPNDWPNKWSQPIPDSCKGSDNQVFQDGCVKIVKDDLDKSIRIVAIVAITVSAVEVVGAVLALCLSSCIKEKRRVY